MFGQKLKKLRETHNYSMDELVEMYNKKFNAKLNKSTLSRYENGLQEPIYTTVVNLASLFNVSVDCLIGKEISSIALEKSDNVYFSLAKEFQDNQIDPDDVREALALIKKIRNQQ